MELKLDLKMATPTQALDGMRRPFMHAFGRGWVGRRLANAAWPAFHAALLHGSGIAVAASHAQTAADECNLRTMLVARWPRRRIAHTVRCAVHSAADAG